MDERSFEVRTDDGVLLRGIATGPATGPGVVLHHGLASSRRIWDLMLPHLGGLRVVTYDARGHGRSGKPGSGYGFDRTVADLATVIRATRLRRPVVAGHSWGAMVALEAAARRSRTVAGAYLIDGGVRALHDEMTWPEVKVRLAPPHLTGTPLPEFRRMIRAIWGDAVEVTPQIEDIVLSLMRVRADGTITPYLRRANHFRILRAIWEQDPMSLHRGLRVPVEALLAHAGGDPAWDAAKRRSAAALRAARAPTRLTWIEGIHDLPLQQPAQVARRLRRFVRRAVG